MYSLGLLGNCQVSALVDDKGKLNWLCVPGPDSPPIFGELLDNEGGAFFVETSPAAEITQSYRVNTAILETYWNVDDTHAFEMVDFCPRFQQHGRMFRPAAFFRILRPVKGLNRIRVTCNPIQGWSKEFVRPHRGNSHLRYSVNGGELRLVTNMPLTYLQSGKEFLLQEPLYFALLWDMPLEDDLQKVSLHFLEQTQLYWQTWVKHCSVPTLFQEDVIRSAITLKLHCYEDTGAILAATTTSLPEKPGEPRNWDYRYCWLRDTFFTLSALFHLGHFEEMEGFLRFLMNITDFQSALAPVYTLNAELPLPEETMENWTGYMNSQPVRIRNAAATQIQNDAYGELVLTLAPIYKDERFHHLRSQHVERMLIWLGEKCIESIGVPDAGLWELRGMQQEHSFTNLMCWAGLDRLVRIMERGGFRTVTSETIIRFKQHRERAAARIIAAQRDGIVRNGPDDDSYDASLLLLPILRFPDKDLCLKTTEGIAKALAPEDRISGELPAFLYRYKREDDFGHPDSAFIICSFWLAQAWAACNRPEDGRRIIELLRKSANKLGLLAEHWDMRQGRHLGNFPQTYSHVGLINSAFAVSPSWFEVL